MIALCARVGKELRFPRLLASHGSSARPLGTVLPGQDQSSLEQWPGSSVHAAWLQPKSLWLRHKTRLHGSRRKRFVTLCDISAMLEHGASVPTRIQGPPFSPRLLCPLTGLSRSLMRSQFAQILFCIPDYIVVSIFCHSPHIRAMYTPL